MDVPELVPMDDYDSEQAKLQASVRWLLAKAHGPTVPPDYKEPFYENQQGELCLKPAVVNGLTSADLYCRACTSLFQDSASQWKNHSSVIQALSRKGIYVMDPNESAVTETTLMQNSPFKQCSHLALIDCVMRAYYKETVTVERVVQAVRKFTSFNASSELPYDTEDALMFWLNKVCASTRHQLEKILEQYQQLDNTQKVQVQKGQHFPVDPVHIPVMDDLLKDINDGCCLATLVFFYCPYNLKLSDIALTDGVGIGDSMYNIQLVLEFCQRHLASSTSTMTLNDLFYTPEELKENLLAMLAELFYWFEVTPLEGVRDTAKALFTLPQFGVEEEEPTKPKSASSLPPISNATKRSFQQNSAPPRPGELGTFSTSSTPDLLNASPSPTMSRSRQALLPRRSQNTRSALHDNDLPAQYPLQVVRRSHSLTSVADGQPRESVRAWEEKPLPEQPDGRRAAGSSPAQTGSTSSVQSALTNVSNISGSSQLLANVSMDTEASLDFTEGSIDLSELDSARTNPHSENTARQRAPNVTDPSHPDYMEVESVASRAATSRTTARSAPTSRSTTQGNPPPKSQPLEPLMPAQIKPSKEKTNLHTKEVERGDMPEKRSPSSPTKPRTLNFANFAAAKGQPNTGGEGDSSGASTPSDEYKTPSVESMPLPGEIQLRTGSQPNAARVAPAPAPAPPSQAPSRTNNYEAFYVGTDATDSQSGGSSFDRSKATEQSFIVKDHPHTPDSARAAGIPIIDDNPRLRTERNSRDLSSSESSDQELKKIHADHRERESQDSFFLGDDKAAPPGAESLDSHRPDSLNLKKPIVVMNSSSGRGENGSPKTSFAQIKKQKENGEVSPVMFSTSSTPSPGSSSLRERFEKNKGAKSAKKTTTFAALPNQTTWQETANKSSPTHDSNKENDRSGQPAASELLNIRMKLEEKRRQIESEKKKMEMQWNKQRQRVGKQAFIQVISKGKGDKDAASSSSKEDPRVLETVKEVSPAEPTAKPVATQQVVRVEVQPERRHSPAPIEVRAPDPVMDEPDPVREGEPSPPAASRVRGRSVDRVMESPAHKPQSPAEKLEQRYRTGTPPPQRTRRDSDGSPKPTRSFSREDIQEKIENVRSKWFPEEEKPKKAPVMSRSAEGIMAPTSRESPQRGSSSGSTSSIDNAGEYNKSLDKLNCSLSELQGEIMRLSLQQDQIKCLVNDDTSRKTPTPPAPTSTARQHPQHDQFYLAPRQTGGEPDTAGAPPSVPTSQILPSYNNSQAPMPPPVQYTQPYPPQPPAPQYPPVPQYPQYMPPAQPQLPMSYPTMQQYPGMAPQYQGAPMFGQGPVYPYQNLPGQGMWQQQQQQQQQYMNPITSSMLHSSLPMPELSPGQAAETLTVSTHSNSSIQSPTSGQQPGRLSPDMNSNYSPSSKTAPLSPSSLLQAQSQSPPRVSSPSSYHSHTPTSPRSTEGQVWLGKNSEEYVPPPIEPQGDLSVSPSQTNAGFFVSFGDSTPKRKPRRRSKDRRREPSPGKQASASESSPSAAAAAATPPRTVASPEPPPQPRPPVHVSPGVGFVIAVDDEAPPAVTELSAMEKKKKKMLEQQMKRRQEQEKERQVKEAERARKRNRQRMKQEEAEQKKEEDKAKREAIFQQYIQKKAEREAAEEESRAGMAPVKRRQRKGTPVRPKSQPPQGGGSTGGGGGHEDKLSTSSHSSQEDLRERKPDARGHPINLPPGNHGDVPDGFELAYGGLTHRRPPSPEKCVRPPPLHIPPPSLVGVPGEVHMATNPTEYAGPKLYVKPSQKSNRHIIINALSHCVLAGTVNNDLKNRVIEEITRSEEKHFVILFRDAFMQYRGLYTYNPEKEEVVKIHGVGPRCLVEKAMDRFYKYNSGTKSFLQISTTKHMSATVDAITIQSALWQKKKREKEKPPPMY